VGQTVVGDAVPERAQTFESLLWRIAREQSGGNATDGDAHHPGGLTAPFGHPLVDAGMIGAERSAALQQKDLVVELAYRPGVYRHVLSSVTGLTACRRNAVISLSGRRPVLRPRR